MTVKQFILHPVFVAIIIVHIFFYTMFWNNKATYYNITAPIMFWADIYIVGMVSIILSMFYVYMRYIKWYEKNIQ